MQRFFEGSVDGHDDEKRPAEFSHKKELKIPKAERTAEIALNYANWYVKDVVNDILNIEGEGEKD